MSDLISLEDHELRMDAIRKRFRKEGGHTGVACRQCRDQEYAYADEAICASWPPKRWVVCPRCGDRTTITV